MTTKLNVNLDLRSVQEQVEDSVKQARKLSRKAVLASLGLAGMAYDTGKSMWEESAQLLERAEKRGGEIEETFNEKVTDLQDQVNEEVHSLRSQVQNRVKEMADRIKPAVLSSRTVEVGSVKIAVEVEEEPPLADYGELTVQDVIGRLGEQDREMMQRIRAYEITHKNRVTVVREIDDRLQMPATA